MKQIFVISSVAAVIVAGIVITMLYNTRQQETKPQPPSPLSSSPSTPAPGNLVKQISTQQIPDAHDAFQFTARIPTTWIAQAIPGVDAISLYDPNTPGSSPLEQSQIFIRYFSANQFLTLNSVTIHNQQSLQYSGRPAVRYDIEKKVSVPNFPNQPTWRSQRHIVTDIRMSTTNPSVFYVIAKNPTLDEETYQQFLNSIEKIN